MSIVLIWDPRGAIFLGAVVPEKYIVFPVRLLIILYHLYIMAYFSLGNLALSNTFLTSIFHTMPIYIRELRIGQNQNTYKMSNSLRTAANIRHVFRSLQIMVANGLCFLGIFFLISQATFTWVAVYTNFVLIRYWSQLHLVSKGMLLSWSLSFTGFWVVMLQYGKLLFTKGKRVLGSWKGNKWSSLKANRDMRRFIRSCQPITFSYGRQYVIKRVHLLLYFRGVTRATFKALLATKK